MEVTLRRDENGRPVGLDWDAISPVGPTTEPTVIQEEKRPNRPTGKGRGSEKKIYCINGHLLEEWGKVRIKNGRPSGRYCTFPGCNNGRLRRSRLSSD